MNEKTNMTYQDMAKVIYEVLQKKRRLCEYNSRDDPDCSQCPLSVLLDGNKDMYVCNLIPYINFDFTLENIETAVKVICDYANDHPQKTYIQDFCEKFPNAQKNHVIHNTCRQLIYGEDVFCSSKCVECWNMAMPEQREE